MKKCFAIISVLISCALCGCNSIIVDPGVSVDKSFTIGGNYDALNVSNAFDVTIDKDATDVTITVGENIMPNVIVEQVDGELRIYCKPPVVAVNGTEFKAVIPYSSELKDVTLSGASRFNTQYPLVGKNVSLDLSGASRFIGDLSGSDTFIELSGASRVKSVILAGDVNLTLSGASEADLTGVCVNLDLDMSGASRNVDNIVLKSYGLECANCKGSISGASKAYIHCLKDIKVSLSGASELHYTGDATTGDSSASGSSKIVHDTF